MCCREHDFCPEYIEAGQSKYGLTNAASYTRYEFYAQVDESHPPRVRLDLAESARIDAWGGQVRMKLLITIFFSHWSDFIVHATKYFTNV